MQNLKESKTDKDVANQTPKGNKRQTIKKTLQKTYTQQDETYKTQAYLKCLVRVT